MQLNIDCMRDVLLTVESANFLEEVTLSKIQESLPEYTKDDISYTILKLNEANFIKARIKYYNDGLYIFGVSDITYAGHQFLADIRADNVWSKVKSTSKSIGATSISAITQITSAIVTELIKAQLGVGL